MKVLYVEDNPANVFLVKRVARMGNHEIVNYIDGDKAIEKFDEINPDLVLMDIQLAGSKSGLDVVKVLRAKGVKTPIIAVTAYAMVGDKERCIEAGCTDYLPKPLPIQRLVEIFKQHAERTSQEASKAESVIEKDTADVPAVTTPDTTEASPVAGKDTADVPAATASNTTEDTATKATEQASTEVSPVAQNKIDADTSSPATDNTSNESATVETKSEESSSISSTVEKPATAQATTGEDTPSTDNADASVEPTTNAETVMPENTVSTSVEPIDNAKELPASE